MLDVFGTLNLPELFWLLTNVVGLVLAVAATGEAQMDHEAVGILGRRGTIAGADVRARLLKATGNRRDEAIKALAHGLMLTIGIIVAASPTPRVEYEAFTAIWSAVAVIAVAISLSVGSVYSLRDRRLLWSMFETEDHPVAGALPEDRPASLEPPPIAAEEEEREP